MILPWKVVSVSGPMSEVGLPKLVWWVCHGYKMNTEAGTEHTSNLIKTLSMLWFSRKGLEMVTQGIVVCWVRIESYHMEDSELDTIFNIYRQKTHIPSCFIVQWQHYITGDSKVLKSSVTRREAQYVPVAERSVPAAESKQTRALNIGHSISWKLPQWGGARDGSNQPKCRRKLAPWTSLVWVPGIAIPCCKYVWWWLKLCSKAKHGTQT